MAPSKYARDTRTVTPHEPNAPILTSDLEVLARCYRTMAIDHFARNLTQNLARNGTQKSGMYLNLKDQL